jgi:hypothetical protein
LLSGTLAPARCSGPIDPKIVVARSEDDLWCVRDAATLVWRARVVGSNEGWCGGVGICGGPPVKKGLRGGA